MKWITYFYTLEDKLGGFTTFKAKLVGPVGICLDKQERPWMTAVSGRVASL